ncbi:MAG: MerR family transcriptional regulator [Motilibacteraceae bacterium]
MRSEDGGEARSEGWSVGELARLAGVTVRTLHHYHQVGLLRPTGRTAAGYRRYAAADVDRLARILRYRELGFALDEVARLVDDPDVDEIGHLRRQHELLTARIERMLVVAADLERTMEAVQMGIRLSPEEMFEVFGDEDPARHAAEAEQRWGDTDAYAQSQRRTSSYGKSDWLEVKAEQEAVEQRFAALLATGASADGAEARAAAEEHRQLITRRFYDLSPAMHVNLAEMYLADPRFTEHYERRAPGLAAYVHDSIVANAART